MMLQEIKDQYADSRGYVDWEDYYVNNLDESVEALVDEIAKLYAKAKLEEAADRAERDILNIIEYLADDNEDISSSQYTRAVIKAKKSKESITETPLE